MDGLNATVRMDERGRIVIPEAIRKVWDVVGEECVVQVKVGLVGTADKSDGELPTIQAVGNDEDE